MDNCFSKYDFFFIVCEGTSESNIINWLERENHFFTDVSNLNFKYLVSGRRECGKLSLVEEISSTDTENKVAILYVHDSKNEELFGKKSKAYRFIKRFGLNIPVINVLTHPEIEILLILKEPKLKQKWMGKKLKHKPSELCSEFYKTDVKRENFFIEQFSSLNEFISICKQYKEQSKLPNKEDTVVLYDIINANTR